MKDIKEKLIIVAGASHKKEKYGFKIFRDLIGAGFNVEGINPAGGEILGREIFKTLKGLKAIPDLVITVVPPEITEKIIEDGREIGLKEIWMQPGSESEAAVKRAREYGMTVTSNACFMVRYGIW